MSFISLFIIITAALLPYSVAAQSTTQENPLKLRWRYELTNIRKISSELKSLRRSPEHTECKNLSPWFGWLQRDYCGELRDNMQTRLYQVLNVNKQATQQLDMALNTNPKNLARATVVLARSANYSTFEMTKIELNKCLEPLKAFEGQSPDYTSNMKYYIEGFKALACYAHWITQQAKDSHY